MYIYIRPCTHFDKQRGYEVLCTYRRGLSALFVPDSGIAEGLEHGTNEGERNSTTYSANILISYSV